MTKQRATESRVRELLSYDDKTGVFTWRILHGRKNTPGKRAGYLNQRYVRIGIDGKDHFAHSLAWLLTHGAYPEFDLDHIDGDRSNNRMENLRAATRSENLQNQRAPRSDNTSGFLGVSWDSKRCMFKAALKLKGKTVFTYRAKTAIEASQAYLAAKRQFHPFSGSAAEEIELE